MIFCVVNVGCIYSSPQTERVQFILIVESDFTNFYLLQLSNYFRLGLDQVLSFFWSSNHIDPSTPFFFCRSQDCGLESGAEGLTKKEKRNCKGFRGLQMFFFLLLSLGFRMEDGDELYGYLISMFFCCWALELIVAEIVAAIIN